MVTEIKIKSLLRTNITRQHGGPGVSTVGGVDTAREGHTLSGFSNIAFPSLVLIHCHIVEVKFEIQISEPLIQILIFKSSKYRFIKNTLYGQKFFTPLR